MHVSGTPEGKRAVSRPYSIKPIRVCTHGKWKQAEWVTKLIRVDVDVGCRKIVTSTKE